MQENTNWYWKQQPLQQTIVVPTRTILHPRLDVTTIRYVKDTPKNVCNMIQQKKTHNNILLVILMLIVIIFWMTLSVVKILSLNGM